MRICFPESNYRYLFNGARSLFVEDIFEDSPVVASLLDSRHAHRVRKAIDAAKEAGTVFVFFKQGQKLGATAVKGLNNNKISEDSIIFTPEFLIPFANTPHLIFVEDGRDSRGVLLRPHEDGSKNFVMEELCVVFGHRAIVALCNAQILERITELLLDMANNTSELIQGLNRLDEARGLHSVDGYITTIEVERGRYQRGAGSHASPIQHTRRGHYRTLKSGRTVWVNDALVGEEKGSMPTTSAKRTRYEIRQ